MKTQQSDIDAILRKEDLEGYIGFGAPTDEYSSEAQLIASALSELDGNQLNEENIITIVSAIWAQSFNLGNTEIEQRLPAFRKVANLILN
jgi:hypothetical protein